MESVAPANLTEGGAVAYGEPGAASEPSTVVSARQPVSQPIQPNAPHAMLRGILQGISDGLAGFSAGVASKGRVSGAAVVQDLEGQRAEQQQKATASAQAQKNAELQNQLTNGAVNEMNIKNHILGQTWNDDVNKSHFATQEAGLAVQQKAQEIFDTTGRVPTGWSADPSTGQVTQGKPGAPATGAVPVAGTPAAPSMYDRRGAILLDAAGKELADDKGNEDPSVTAARQVFANPASTIEQKQQALIGVQQKAGLSAQVVKNLTAKADLKVKQSDAAAAAPFGDKATALNAAMLDRYKVLNPTATALPSGLVMSADSTPKDFDRADKVLQQTETAQATKANRDIVNGMREQTLKLSGLGAPGGNTKLSGDAYLQSLPDAEQALVKEIGIGKAAPKRMDMLLSRNPKLSAEVALAYPDFDSSKAGSYPKLYEDFTSGKTSVALNAGGTALGHLYELQQLNTPASHVPHTPSWTAYQNKAATVSTELAKFYGDASIPAIANIQTTLTSTLPGNRDAAIRTQAQSMGDKLDSFEQEWKNGAPSKAYEAEMPGISPQAKAARAKLDPNYAASQQQAPTTTQPTGSDPFGQFGGKTHPQ
jgi:hypothetical protein